MTLKMMLEKTASRYKDKIAIISSNRRISYIELDKASNRMANALIGMGVSKGDRVAMILSNRPEFVISYFGILKAGATAVPLDTQYKIDELISIFGDCQPKLLVTENSTIEPILLALPTFPYIKHVINVGEGYETQILSYQKIMATSSPHQINGGPEPDDIAHIAYTSGPSFQPRGAMLSHRSIVIESGISADGFQQTDKDIVMLFALPMFHVMGLVAVMMASVNRGSTVVIVPGTGLSIGIFMSTIEKERGTMFLGVPYIFTLAANMAETEGIKSDLTSLRLCGSAGAPLSRTTRQRFKQYYGFSLVDFLGLTEGVCHFSCQLPDESDNPDSVGKTLPGWEVKIVDDNGQELPPNQPGEIIVKGPMMKGYYNNPRATAEIIKDGWLYTGDIGKKCEDGHLFITGRKKDIVITKGQNISPGDIEYMLLKHPKVAEAAVIGIPDEMRGEVVGATIVLKPGEVATDLEIKQFCLDHMASYKAPKQVIFLDSLPRTTTGEIDRKSLRTHLLIPPVFPEPVTS